jgi:hypothetical protein
MLSGIFPHHDEPTVGQQGHLGVSLIARSTRIDEELLSPL